MLFNIIILFMVASIAWVLWTERKSKQALDKDALDQAWREVPDDPHYIERRHYEERMRVEDEARAAAAKRRASDRAGSAEADLGTRGIRLSLIKVP